MSPENPIPGSEPPSPIDTPPSDPANPESPPGAPAAGEVEEEDEEDDEQTTVIKRGILVFAGVFLLGMLLLRVYTGGLLMPVSLHLYLIPFLVIALSISLLSMSLDAYWGCFMQVVLLAAALFLNNHVIYFHEKMGLAHAQRYGQQVGTSVNLLNLREKTWVRNLGELPANLKPSFNPWDIVPYLSAYQEKEEYYRWIGGFALVYRLEGDQPILALVRGNIRWLWNWHDLRWDKPKVDDLIWPNNDPEPPPPPEPPPEPEPEPEPKAEPEKEGHGKSAKPAPGAGGSSSHAPKPSPKSGHSEH